MTPDAFADLRDRDTGKRCNGCGNVVDQPCRVNIGVGRNRHGEQTEWLYRKGMTICERCAARAVRGFLDALDDTSGVD